MKSRLQWRKYGRSIKETKLIQFCFNKFFIFWNHNSVPALMCMFCIAVIEIAHCRTYIQWLWTQQGKLKASDRQWEKETMGGGRGLKSTPFWWPHYTIYWFSVVHLKLCTWYLLGYLHAKNCWKSNYFDVDNFFR